MRKKIQNFIFKKYKVFTLSFLLSLSGLSGAPALAARVYVTTPSGVTAAGDVIPVEVLIDTEKTSINVVEGTVTLQAAKSDIEMREVNVAGADFTLWTRKPSWVKESQTINFVGGEPGGINGTDKLLFRMFMIPQSKGEIKVIPNVTAFANDGKGTVVAVAATPMTITVSSREATSTDQWRDTVSSDNTPPEILSAEIGRDASLHDGQLFLVIRAEDSETGIDHIEVKEGDRDPVRSGNEYVLQDQDQSTKIIIAAFDKAGNVQLLEISPLQKSIGRYVLGGIIIGLVVIISAIILRRKKKDV